MANNFKRYTARSVGTSNTSVGSYTVPANTQVTVIGLILSNRLANSAISVSAMHSDGANSTFIVTGALVPIGGSIYIDPKLVLQSGDSVLVSSSTANSLDVIMSTLEIS